MGQQVQPGQQGQPENKVRQVQPERVGVTDQQDQPVNKVRQDQPDLRE